MSRWQSRYLNTDPQRSEGKGVCDYSGFVFNIEDLHKQMLWRGNSLVWTGLMVGAPFLDTPNPQERTPVIKADPLPLPNARPQVPEDQVEEVPPYPILLKQLNNVRFS